MGRGREGVMMEAEVRAVWHKPGRQEDGLEDRKGNKWVFPMFSEPSKVMQFCLGLDFYPVKWVLSILHPEP